MSDSEKETLAKAMRDQFGRAWPESIVGYLNARFDLFTKQQKQHALSKLERRCRREQNQVRELVDKLLAERDRAKQAEVLTRALRGVKVQPTLLLRSRLGLKPGHRGSPYTLHWFPPLGPVSERKGEILVWLESDPRDGALLDLARLLDSSLWDTLRKCPNCATYFLAGHHRRKKYCGKECMWVWLQRKHRAGLGAGEMGRQRKARAKRYREVIG